MSIPRGSVTAAPLDEQGRPRLYYREHNEAVDAALLEAALRRWQDRPVPVAWVTRPDGQAAEVRILPGEGRVKPSGAGREAFRTAAILIGVGMVFLLLGLLT